MSDFKIYKEISTVPSNISSDSMYAVRTGPGFDLYLSDTTGTVAYKINSTSISSVEDNLVEMTSEGLLVKIKEASDIDSFILTFDEALNRS